MLAHFERDRDRYMAYEEDEEDIQLLTANYGHRLCCHHAPISGKSAPS